MNRLVQKVVRLTSDVDVDLPKVHAVTFGETQPLQATGDGGLPIGAREEVQDADRRLAVPRWNPLRGKLGVLDGRGDPLRMLAGVGLELAVDFGCISTECGCGPGVVVVVPGVVVVCLGGCTCGWESGRLAWGSDDSQATQCLAKPVSLVVDV